jgi:GT2 family glycosyltransferase
MHTRTRKWATRVEALTSTVSSPWEIMELPFFSIIVPTYKRPQALAECLRALENVDYPRERLEVIVVDDGSPSPPEAVVRKYARRLPVRLVSQDHAGPAAARNRGADLAGGDFLAFVDDDCRLSPTWLQLMAGRFRDIPTCAATGRTENVLNRNIFAKTSQTLIGFLYAHYNADPTRARFLTSNNMAISAELFRLVGGFDTSFLRAAGEDRELCDRLLAGGHRVVYVPDAVVLHAHELTLSSFLSQHFHYGRAAYNFHRLRARRHKRGIRFEPCRFYFALMGHAFEGHRGPEAIGVMFMLGLTQVATALGFFREGFLAVCRPRAE